MPAIARPGIPRRCRIRLPRQMTNSSTSSKPAIPRSARPNSSPRCACRSRTRKRKRPISHGVLAGVRPRDIKDRAALAALPVTRKSDLIELQKAAPPFAGMTAAAAGGARARVHVARADVRSRRQARRLLAARARDVRRRLSRRRARAQHVFLPLHAGRLHGRHGRARARLPGVSRRHGTDRDAGRGDREPQAARATSARRRSCASFSKKATNSEPIVASLKKALVSAEALPASAARMAQCARRRPRCNAMRSPISDWSPTRSAAQEGMIVDEGVIVELVRPGTGEPVARGRSRRSRGDDADARISADPLRDRRSVGDARRCEPLRPHQYAHQGLARPRRPDGESERHVRQAVADRRRRQASRGNPQVPARDRSR